VHANGGKTAVVGVPVTYPVTEIDGLMVSGFLSPGAAVGRGHPKRVLQELPEDYRFYIGESPDASRIFRTSQNDLLERLYASTDAKLDLLERIMNGDLPGSGEHLDLVCMVLSESDWIQHYFLKNPEEVGAGEGEETVLNFFQHVDERLGEIIDTLDPNDTIGLVSDHGFGKQSTHHVHLNKWLQRQGYLQLETNSHSTSLKRKIGARIRNVARIPGFSRIKQSVPQYIKSQAIALSTLSDEEIDWQETAAVFRKTFSNTAYIQLNHDVVGPAHQSEFIDEIVSKLRAIRHPTTGSRVFEEVKKSAEHYHGPGVNSLPEVVMTFCSEYTGNESVGVNKTIRRIPEGGRPGVAHRMRGLYVFAGKGVLSTDGPTKANIKDIAPTVYELLEFPQPQRIDGEPMSHVTTPDSLRASVSYSMNRQFATGETDTRDVKNRLEDLGYM
jgi:predicted AlkP superfamily phosphohydrolase/phosphomutase